MSPPPDADVNLLSEPLTLACGLTLPNRLVKAAMEEGMSSLGGGPPNQLHGRLYWQWAEGGWGLIITGNCMVDPRHLGLPFDLAIRDSDLTDPAALVAWRGLAEAAQKGGAPALVQLNHPGRQSCRCMVRPPWSPCVSASAVPLRVGESVMSDVIARVAMGTPRAMDQRDVDEVVNHFRRAAELAWKTGFKGVQLHAAHGYLLAQFMSPMTNRRTDEYGATPRGRLLLLSQIVSVIRDTCGAEFCVGVKLNAADYVDGGLTEDEALEHVRWIDEMGGVDFVEVSGGNYTNPQFLDGDDAAGKAPTGTMTRTEWREAFFLEFAQRARSALPPSSKLAIMLTGGLRSRSVMASVLRSHSADLVGVGRPSCVYPSLPRTTFLDPSSDGVSPPYMIRGEKQLRRVMRIRILGGTIVTKWHELQLRRLSLGRKTDPELRLWVELTYAGWEWLGGRGRLAFLGAWVIGLLRVFSWVLTWWLRTRTQ